MPSKTDKQDIEQPAKPSEFESVPAASSISLDDLVGQEIDARWREATSAIRTLSKIPVGELDRRKINALILLIGEIVSNIEDAIKPLPDIAPELWEFRDKSKGETPQNFSARVYGPYFFANLPAILRLDGVLYNALRNPYWIKINSEKDNPDQRPVPKLNELNNELIQLLESDKNIINKDCETWTYISQTLNARRTRASRKQESAD